MRPVGAKDNFLVIKKKKRKQVLLPEFSRLGHRCPLYLGVDLVREMRPADIDTQLCGPSCFKTGSNGKSELGARDSSTQRGSQGLWVIYLFGGRAKLSRKIIGGNWYQYFLHSNWKYLISSFSVWERPELENLMKATRNGRNLAKVDSMRNWVYVFCLLK